MRRVSFAPLSISFCSGPISATCRGWKLLSHLKHGYRFCNLSPEANRLQAALYCFSYRVMVRTALNLLEVTTLAAQHPYAQGTTILALGTKRGLFLATSQDRRHWDIQATTLPKHRIYNAIF